MGRGIEKKTEGFSRRTVLLIGSSIAAAVLLSIIIVGLLGFSIINTATTKYSEVAEVAPNSLLIKVKESILRPLITAQNTQTLQKGLNCFSMITGHDSRPILQNLSTATQDKALSEKALEIALSLPEDSTPKKAGFINGLKNCLLTFSPRA